MTRDFVPFPDPVNIHERIANRLFSIVIRDFPWICRDKKRINRIIELVSDDLYKIAYLLCTCCNTFFRITHYFDIDKSKKVNLCWQILSELGKEEQDPPMKISFSKFRKIYDDVYKQAYPLINLSLQSYLSIISKASDNLILEYEVFDLNYQLDRALAK